jgi:hypothetical protein
MDTYSYIYKILVDVKGLPLIYNNLEIGIGGGNRELLLSRYC